MSVSALLTELQTRGAQLWYEGERLRFRAPKGALTPELRARLAAARTDVIAHLRAEAATRTETHPLSFAQRALWFLHQRAPNSPAYNVAFSARVVSPLDERALRQALQALVDRHASLRTTYALVDDAPVQRVAGVGAAECVVADVAGLDDSEIHQRVVADYRRPFDLEHGPLVRAFVYRRAADDHVLLLVMHHIAVDGWSLLQLVDELQALYTEAVTGAAADLPRPEIEYTDHVRREREMLAGAEGVRLAAYWRRQLAAPRAWLELPSDRSSERSAVVPAAATFSFDVDASLSDNLRRLARDEGVTLFVVLLAAFKATLHRYTAVEDLIVGTPTFGRSSPDVARVIGDFVNSIPLRSRVTPDLAFRDLFAQLRRTVLDGIDAQAYPLALMVEQLERGRDAHQHPLFGIFFILQRFDQLRALEPVLLPGRSNETVELGALRLRHYGLDQQEGQFDLTLQLVDTTDGAIGAQLKYDADRYDAARIARFADHYRRVLETFVTHPDGRIADLPLTDVTPVPTPNAVAQLLDDLRARDIRLSLEGDKLRVSAPKGAVTEELRTRIASSKEAIIAALRASADADSNDRVIRRIPRDGSLPLSSAQRRLWFLDRMETGAGRARYNIGASIRVRGALDADVLRRAIAELVRRHETLRCRIRERDGFPEVEILENVPVDVRTLDISHLPPDARETEARRLEVELLRTPFDLATAPLAAYQLVKLAPDDHFLTIGVHHIVADGWSFATAMREIWTIYEAFAAGRPHGLAPLAVDYVDYAAWEQEQLASERSRTRRHLEFWKRELDGAPAVLELPTDRPRPATPTQRGARMQLDLDLPQLEPLRNLGRAHDATLFMTLVAAFQVLLHRYSGQDDVVIGSPMANRALPELEPVIGLFVNNLILRGRAGGNPTFAEFLERTKQTVLSAFDAGAVPYELIVDAVRPDRAAAHNAIFQVMLTLHSFTTELPAPPGLSFTFPDAPDLGTTRFDLVLEVMERDNRLTVTYEYSTELFDDDTIRRMHTQFERLLRAVIAAPNARIEELPLLGDADVHQLLDEWNATARDHDRTRRVHDLLEATARRVPDATAVVAGSESITYRELDARANRLAHLLARRGVTPGSLVAVCVDRTLDMPVAIAAVLKAGAAYVPLDPTHPAERLQYTLEDAGVVCAIATSRFASLLAAARAPLVLLDESAAELSEMPETAPAVDVTPSDRAYVIYTSGSTGRPKGVEVEHRNLVAFLEAMRREPGFAESDTLLAVTTLSFDIAELELWLPLSVGGRVVIASRADVLDGERLAALIVEHGVTVMQATPATWRLMLDAGWTGSRGLKVLCGGEALPRDLAAELVPRVAELWNMYGPTETTVWSTVCRIEGASAPITIGRPIDNTRIYILERSGLPAPIGVAGELCIGGEGVARGYHDRPELTAERFVEITLPGGRTERVYRTGDLARYRADGRIEFLGRRDQQVKVRGYRIELGEIEAVLATHPGVKECVTAVRDISQGDQRIVAYVVPEDGATIDPEAARATLRERLPEYMIPSIFTTLSSLPLTPNGKIDRRALPAPTVAPPSAPDVASEMMMTPAQRRVAAVWREVLRTDRVGLHDNFFDSGGHSLLLVRLHANLKREFNVPIELVELFQWTTVAAQANRLSAVTAPNNALQRAQARAARQIHE